MRVIAREERRDADRSEQLVLVGGEVHHVHEGHAFGLGDLRRPLAETTRATLDLAFIPDVPHGQRQNDRRRAPGPGIRNELAYVPAVGVDDLVGVGDPIVDFLGLLAEARQRPASPAVVVNRAAIVVAKLDQDEIARSQFTADLIPEPLRQKRPAAASSASAIDDANLRWIEVLA